MSWMLHGLGVVPWERVRQTCAGLQCAWADYDGFQGGDCPPEAPPYSHLWAWSPDRLVRVRIDGVSGILGVLTRGPTPLDGTVDPESVDVAVTTAMAGDGDAAGQPTTLVRVIGPMPVTFVAGPLELAPMTGCNER